MWDMNSIRSIHHWYRYWPPNTSDIPPGEILQQVSEPLVLVTSIGKQKFGIPTKKIPTSNRYLFGISVPNILVFSWYSMDILRKPLLKFG